MKTQMGVSLMQFSTDYTFKNSLTKLAWMKWKITRLKF